MLFAHLLPIYRMHGRFALWLSYSAQLNRELCAISDCNMNSERILSISSISIVYKNNILVLLICLFNITLYFVFWYNLHHDGARESGTTLISHNKCNHIFFKSEKLFHINVLPKSDSVTSMLLMILPQQRANIGGLWDFFLNSKVHLSLPDKDIQ